jgi:putative PIN family toxin of toxin-antitoxin system
MSGRRFVFDTNTIISAFLFENGKPGRALDLAEEAGRLFVSTETAEELSEVLQRERFDDYVDRETRHELLLALLEEAELAEVTEQIEESRDPDDDKFLELAVEIGAECIVSGDKDLLALESIRGIPILTADEFLRRAEEGEA